MLVNWAKKRRRRKHGIVELKDEK